ncbi:hypothetical protein Vretimale_5066 [Volvox reticuliferus]|uniref:Uncharacterized protein n=2 Tax=Volvox reticuliferus TaxID=1737510 RepID=A0A8J4G4N5_9CHLO|nr:hypothetical protein Vretimale_5066 [Volvox reticuliferus]
MCQMLKRTQRYPALGCPCRTCNSLLEIRAPETEASRLVREQIGCVALVRAVQAGGPHCIEVMELLLKHGALLDGQDYDGRTALHQAIRYNRLAEAAWLTSKGAHLDIPDFEGLLPLHQAGCSGFFDITRLLVNAGAPLNLHTIKYVSQEQLDAQAKKQAEGPLGSKKAKRKQQLDVSGLTTIGGNSPLALAIRHGHGAIVEYLLSQNAVFDLKNAADSSAFHAALDKGSAAIAGLLLQHINKKAVMSGVSGASGSGGTSSRSPTAVKGGGSSAREREKEGRLSKREAKREAVAASRASGDKEKGEGRDTVVSGSEGGAGEGAGASGAGAGASAAPVEPPVAFDAGAGLREMVLRERERLRQQLGLSTTSSSGNAANGGGSGSAGTSGVTAEPKSVLSIFARNSGSSSAGAALRSAAAATAAPPLPPDTPGAAPLSSVSVSATTRSSSNGSGEAGGICSGVNTGGAVVSCNSNALEEKRSGGSSVGNGSTATCDSSMSEPPSSGSAGESSISSTASTKVPYGEEAPIAQQTCSEQQQERQQRRQQQKHEAEEEEEEVDRTAATAGSGRVRTCGDKPATAATSTCSEVVSTDDSPGDTGQQLEQAMAGTALGGEAGSGETSATPVSAALLPSAVMPPPPPPSQQQQELSGSRKPVPQKEVEPFPQPQPSQPPQQMAGASSAKTLEILEAPAAASAQAAHGPTVSIVSTSVSPPDPGSGKDASKSVASGQLQVRPPTVVSAQPMAPSKQGSAARPVLTACGTENLNKTKNGMDPGTAVTAAPSAAASVLPMVSPIKVKFRAKPVEAPPASPGLAATAVAAPQSTNMIATKAMATAAQPPPPPPPPPSAMVSIPSEPAIITCTKIRRGGRVITVPAAMTSNRNRGADQQQPTASKHNHMGGAESSGPAYLTIPASLLSARPQAGSSVAAAMMGPSSSLNPGGVASATGGATLSSSGAVPAATVGSLAGRNTSAPAAVAVVTGVSSGLRPAALSYSPGGISGQLYFQAQTPQQQQQQQQPPASPALSIAPASMPAAAAMLAGSLMPPPCSSSTAPAEATLPAGASLPPPSTGPLPCFPQPPHAHMQGPAASLSILPQPHLQPLAMPAVPPPPPGFAPRPMSDKPPLAAATALPPPPPTQALTPLVHTSAAIPAGTGGLSPPMSSAADVAMPEMENLVLSVVDQGLEESVGVGALGGRLMLGGGEVGSDNASGLVAGGGGIQAAGGGVAAVADGRWPHPHDHTTAAMLPTGGLPTDRRGAITGTSGSVLVDTQPVGLHRNIRHAPAVPMGPQPAGTIHAATAAAGSGGGSVTAGGGAVTSGPFLGTSIAAAMSRAHSDELGTLGGLLERSSSLAAPAVAGGGDAALAATGAVLDRTNDQAGGTSATASGGIASRTASQHTLSRYDSGGILGQPSHGTSVALFSADVWAADGGAMAGAAAAGGMDGGGGSERRSAHGDSWVAMAEAQQLQLSQAMEALANGPVGAPAATVVATASGSFVPPGSSGLLAFAGASLMPLPAVPVTASAVSATAAVTDASGSRTDAAATPATEMAPLPELPAFLFDEVDEHKYQRLFQNHEAGDGRESAGDASCITSAAGSGGSGAAAGMGPWVNGSTLMAGPVGRPGSGGVVAGVDGHPPPPPPGGTRPMMFGAAGPGAVTSIGPGVNASIGMGQMGVPPQVPYGHGPGVLYTPAMGSHAAAAFGGGHPGYPNAGPGPYCDWYGTAAAATYGGFRQPMMVSPSGGMFGTAAQAAAMPGGRVGGLMPQASHAPQAPTAQGSFTSSSQPHTHSHPLTIQQSQQGAAPAAAQASAWFTGGGGKAAALSGMTARIGGGGGSSGNAASSGAAGPAEAASAGPISGGGTGGGGGNGNSSGSGVRHSHSRSGKGRR